MKKIFIKQWIKTMRLSVTIPAGLLVHASAKLAHEETNWILVLEAFLVASMAMIHNDYYDRTNDIKKGKSFAFENPQQFKIIIILGWTIVFALALSTLLKYWLVLIPVILISLVYSYTRKVMYVPVLCVAFTSASPFLIGHLDLEKNKFNYVFFGITFLAIYAREMVKDIEDYQVDKNWKSTPVSTQEQCIDTYLDHAGQIMELCSICLIGFTVVSFKRYPDYFPVVTIIFLCFACIFCLLTLVWKNSDSVPGVLKIRYLKERSEDTVFRDLKRGKSFFLYAMLCMIIALSIM